MQKLLLYKFELNHNAKEAMKNISCMKGEGAVDKSTVKRWFKKFCLGCKNLDDQAKSSSPKTMDSEITVQAIDANLISKFSIQYSLSSSWPQ